MTTINDIPGDTPAEQRDWLFKQWCGVSEMLDKAISQRDELRKAAAALEAERNRLQQAVNEAWDITSEPISSEVEMHPRIIQIMDALQDALSKPTLDKYNVKLD